jgi:stearoyl-CoA desaturase (delta-9 desaturase)
MSKTQTKEYRNPPKFKDEVGIGLIHLSPLLIFLTGSHWFDWFVCFTLYVVRMFFITGGYHRYFAHKTYKTSRFFQFIIAFMAQTSVQKGALWWAAHHRDHHKLSDTPADPHSRKWYGFLYSHILWIVGPDYKKTEYNKISDFAKYPELVWLNKHFLHPVIAMVIAVFFMGNVVNGGGIDAFFSWHGLSTVVIGFFVSTAFLYHGTFSINSLMHMWGKKRYDTGDESKNHWLLALITLGEGWHNNHHYYPSSVRQGFFWWEFDITYYTLRTFEKLGLVWDLNPVPVHIKYSKNREHAKQLKALNLDKKTTRKQVTELEEDTVNVA